MTAPAIGAMLNLELARQLLARRAENAAEVKRTEDALFRAEGLQRECDELEAEVSRLSSLETTRSTRKEPMLSEGGIADTKRLDWLEMMVQSNDWNQVSLNAWNSKVDPWTYTLDLNPDYGHITNPDSEYKSLRDAIDATVKALDAARSSLLQAREEPPQ